MVTSLVVNPVVIFYHTKKRASEAKLLFILLGVFDFTTLFLTPIVNVESFLSGSPDEISGAGARWYKQVATWNNEICVQYSAFITSVLSLTRCISIAHPFYQINVTLLVIFLVVWFVYLLGFRIVMKYLESSHYGCDFVWDPFAQLIVPHVECSQLATSSYKMIYVINATVLQRGVWIIISLFSLIFTLTKLHRRPNKSAKRSEITVIILTAAYLFAFIPMIVENVLWLSNMYMLADNGYYLYYVMVTYPGQLLSAVNPLIIIMRSRELQGFLVKCIRHPFSRSRSPYLNTISAVQHKVNSESPKVNVPVRILQKISEQCRDLPKHLPSNSSHQSSDPKLSCPVVSSGRHCKDTPSQSVTLSPVSNCSDIITSLSSLEMRRTRRDDPVVRIVTRHVKFIKKRPACMPNCSSK